MDPGPTVLLYTGFPKEQEKLHIRTFVEMRVWNYAVYLRYKSGKGGNTPSPSLHRVIEVVPLGGKGWRHWSIIPRPSIMAPVSVEASRSLHQCIALEGGRGQGTNNGRKMRRHRWQQENMKHLWLRKNAFMVRFGNDSPNSCTKGDGVSNLWIAWRGSQIWKLSHEKQQKIQFLPWYNEKIEQFHGVPAFILCFLMWSCYFQISAELSSVHEEACL